MSVSLRAFTCGWFTQPMSFFLEGGGDTLHRSPVPAYLIEHPKGLALFDTGFPAKLRSLYAMNDSITFGEGDDISAQLLTAGIDPARVRWIINSHLHLDHCGGNAQIPNATIIVQRAELEIARNTEESFLYDRELYDTGQPIQTVGGEHDLFGDGSVVVFPTYGHTCGHQSVRVKLPDGDVVLAGDCCYLKRSLDELRVSPSDNDKEQALSTLRRLSSLRNRGVRIFYGHDGEFWKSIHQGVALR